MKFIDIYIKNILTLQNRCSKQNFLRPLTEYRLHPGKVFGFFNLPKHEHSKGFRL